MVTSTDKAYKNPKATLTTGLLGARNQATPMRKGGVLTQAANQRAMGRARPPVPATAPPVSSAMRQQSAMAQGARDAGPGEIARQAIDSIRGRQGPTPGTVGMPSYAPMQLPDWVNQYAPLYSEGGGQQPGYGPGKGEGEGYSYPGTYEWQNPSTPEGETNVYAEYLKMQEEGTAPDLEQWKQGIAGAAGWDKDTAAPSRAHGATKTGETGQKYKWNADTGKWEARFDDPLDQMAYDKTMAGLEDPPSIDEEAIWGGQYGIGQQYAQKGSDLMDVYGAMGGGRSGLMQSRLTELGAKEMQAKADMRLKAEVANMNAEMQTIQNAMSMYADTMGVQEQKYYYDRMEELQGKLDTSNMMTNMMAWGGLANVPPKIIAEIFQRVNAGEDFYEVIAEYNLDKYKTEEGGGLMEALSGIGPTAKAAKAHSSSYD